MTNGKMDGSAMASGMGSIAIRAIVVLPLAAGALVKYLFTAKRKRGSDG